MGFMLAGVAVALVWMGEKVKQLSSYEGRKVLREEVKESTRFVVQERRYFLKEFRVTIAIFSILVFAFMVALLD